MPLTKYIVRFIGGIVEVMATLAVFAGVVAGGVSGAAFANGDGAALAVVILVTVVAAMLGGLLGFLVAAVIFGVPMLFLRMNENLEQIDRTLRSFDGARVDLGVERPRAEPNTRPAVWQKPVGREP